jgi:predicted MPP superfamily phosphohydrolase
VLQALDSPCLSLCALWAVLLAALAIYAFVVEPGRIVVRQVEVPIPGLPPALDGLRIGQVSDLHRGPLMPRSRVEKAIARMAAQAPDLVALTGDFFSGEPGYAAEYRDVLVPLRPRLGLFACLGNHDHWHGADAVVAALEGAGVTVLRNQHHLLTVGETQLCIVGIDDIGAAGLSTHHAAPHDDLPAALIGSPLSGAVRILLAHNPDFTMGPVFARETARRPIHLVLSGHTHGGQVRLPLLGAPRVPSRYRLLFSGGLVRVAGTWVYVSRGAGTAWSVRFNCPPEVNVITLRPG